MNLIEIEIVNALDKSIKADHLSDLAFKFRRTVGSLGKGGFKVKVGFINVYKKIYQRDPELFIKFMELVKPEVFSVKKMVPDCLVLILMKEKNWGMLEALSKTWVPFNRTNVRGESPFSHLMKLVEQGDKGAKDFFDKNKDLQFIRENL